MKTPETVSLEVDHEWEFGGFDYRGPDELEINLRTADWMEGNGVKRGLMLEVTREEVVEILLGFMQESDRMKESLKTDIMLITEV